MTKPSLLVLDTLDDRREIHSLLHRLPPPARVRFLAWACAVVPGVRGNRPLPQPMPEMVRDAVRCGRGDDRLTNSVYFDVLVLAAQWELDLRFAAEQLERLVRRPGYRLPPPSSSACAPPAAPVRTVCSSG